MSEIVKKTLAVGIAGVTTVVVAAWRRIQRDNSMPEDEIAVEPGVPLDQSPKDPVPTPDPASEPTRPTPGSSLFTPSVDEKSTKAELYDVATELGIEGRSKMTKSELLKAIRAAS